jgi:hypothetical protein
VINRDSDWNYHLIDDESTGGMDVPPGISSSGKRNPSEGCLFRRELPAQGREIHWRNGIPTGTTSSHMMNPPKEGISLGIAIYAESVR